MPTSEKTTKNQKKKNSGKFIPTEVLIVAETEQAGIAQYAAHQSIPVEKLRQHLSDFTAALSVALSSIAAVGRFELTEVEVQATFSAEAGFAWVTKAGVEGGVKLKFTRP